MVNDFIIIRTLKNFHFYNKIKFVLKFTVVWHAKLLISCLRDVCQSSMFFNFFLFFRHRIRTNRDSLHLKKLYQSLIILILFFFLHRVCNAINNNIYFYKIYIAL